MFSAQVPPSLNAAGLIPATSPLTAFFAEGESTTILGTGLPICTIAQQAGSYLELYNVDTGFIAGWHGPFDNTPSGSGFVTPAFWNTTAYPVLNTSYTGLYRCRTDTANSLVTYQLNVRGKFTLYSSRYSICQLFLGSSCYLFVHSCFFRSKMSCNKVSCNNHEFYLDDCYHSGGHQCNNHDYS